MDPEEEAKEESHKSQGAGDVVLVAECSNVA